MYALLIARMSLSLDQGAPNQGVHKAAKITHVCCIHANGASRALVLTDLMFHRIGTPHLGLTPDNAATLGSKYSRPVVMIYRQKQLYSWSPMGLSVYPKAGLVFVPSYLVT